MVESNPHERNDEAQKVRLQIDLSPSELERMNVIMRMAGFKTRKELFNNALSLFEWAAYQVANGQAICSATPPDFKDLTRLAMPAFDNIARYGLRPDFGVIQRAVVGAVEEEAAAVGDVPAARSWKLG